MPKDTASRNLEIHQKWVDAGGYQNQGILTRLGKEYGLTRERIFSIVKRIEEQKGADERIPTKVMFDATLPGCKISQEAKDKLEALAKAREWSVAFTIRAAVIEYLKTQTQ